MAGRPHGGHMQTVSVPSNYEFVWFLFICLFFLNTKFLCVALEPDQKLSLYTSRTHRMHSACGVLRIKPCATANSSSAGPGSSLVLGLMPR